jgi:hypothetical protein
MLNKPAYTNPLKNTSVSNPLYKGFWDEQQKLRQDILNSQYALENNTISELDKYKQEEIKKVQDEVKQYERTHGFSGNFLKDFSFGFKQGNEMFIKPFNKYVSPMLSKLGPTGSAIGSASNTYSGIVDKL